MTLILGIETSCDETAAAVVAEGRTILSNVVASQIELHRRYGGVFPEVASRQHVLSIVPVVDQALSDAGTGWTELDAIAVTEGPGLAGSLLVGINAAKGAALARGLPLVAVNHLEGHVYSNWLAPAEDLQFPILVLIVSGGHTELVLMEGHGRYRRLGGTLDDAAGEAFDKVARLLGLPYPGGPVIQRVAEGGDAGAFALPRALTNKPEHRYNFSFSGLKTAVLRLVEAQRIRLGEEAWPEAYAQRVLADQDMEKMTRGEGERERVIRDVAASFQGAVADTLVAKTLQAAEDFDVGHVCVCGGVAANAELRRQLPLRSSQSTTRDSPVRITIPPIWLCTDNAAMIAAAGHYRYVAGLRSGWDLDVKARWPLASWRG